MGLYLIKMYPSVLQILIKSNKIDLKNWFWFSKMILTLPLATTSEQRPLFWGPEGGRCTHVWLYIETQYLIFMFFGLQQTALWIHFNHFHSRSKNRNNFVL